MKIQLRNRRGATRPARSTKPAGRAAHGAETSEQNRVAVAQALGHAVQPKLSLGRTDDPQEAQADRVASQVMTGGVALSAGGGGEAIQRKCAGCEEEDSQIRRAPAQDARQMEEDEKRKKPPPEEEQSVQRKEGNGATVSSAGDSGGGAADTAASGGAVSGVTAARINSQRGAGVPLPNAERNFFEPRFGSSFAQVRVHADSESAHLAHDLDARAFTVGRDVFFGSGEYRPGTSDGRHLMAHELTHVLQQTGSRDGVVRRWRLGVTPPAGSTWAQITDADQIARLAEAEDIVRSILDSRRCQNMFSDQCPAKFGANPLQEIFDRARVFVIPADDNMFGESWGPNEIAFNERAFRIGRWFMASTLLHEMFHVCDDDFASAHDRELRAENSVERCRIHTPWIDHVTPRAGAVGSRVSIHGWNFGPTQGATDAVRIGGVNANIISWTFDAGTASSVTIVAEVPTGAAGGGVVVVNNSVESNVGRFTVT